MGFLFIKRGLIPNNYLGFYGIPFGRAVRTRFIVPFHSTLRAQTMAPIPNARSVERHESFYTEHLMSRVIQD